MKDAMEPGSARSARHQLAHLPRFLCTVAGAVLVASALLLLVGLPTRGNAESAQSAAQALDKKLRVLQTVDAKPHKSYPAITITDFEADSYLQIHGREFLPPGVADPSVHFLPEHVSAFGDVNFDEFNRQYTNPNDWGPKILAAMFKGKQRVTVAGKVQSGNGLAKVQIETVTVGTMTVPSWLVDFVLVNYLQPLYKFDLGKPIALPDHVTQIVLGAGQATCLRSPNKSN